MVYPYKNMFYFSAKIHIIFEVHNFVVHKVINLNYI